ncbi:MAG: iron-containing alcohol dehydrogenase, partial [Planctomycetota bacterium]|nr:iron-containing alcohol dehydrogenase [Planctomycetota bacterium]
FSRESCKLLPPHFQPVIENPQYLNARGGMLLGSALAGLAIENSMLGAAHALANPLTAEYGIAHGQAVGLMLPHVIRFNGVEFGGLYSELLNHLSPKKINDADDQHNTHELAEFIQQLLTTAGLATRLSTLDVDSNILETLAIDASKQWTGGFNPRPVDAETLQSLYQQAY